jgi:hypothetical protein
LPVVRFHAIISALRKPIFNAARLPMMPVIPGIFYSTTFRRRLQVLLPHVDDGGFYLSAISSS